MNTIDFYSRNQTDNPIIDDRMRKMISLVARCRPSTLLDIGCGRGTLINALRSLESSCQYVGVEVSQSLGSEARSHGIEVVEADLAAPLPFPDAAFDVVVFGEVIEHLLDPDFALDEIYRVLKPGGFLIASTPNLACWLNRLLVPLGIQPIFTETSSRRKYGRRFGILGQRSDVIQGHIRVMTYAAFSELLADRGYTVQKLIGCRFYDLDRNRFSRFVDTIFSHCTPLASGTIAQAAKLK